MQNTEKKKIKTSLLKKQAEAWLPTEWGKFRILAFSTQKKDPMPHLAFVHENFSNDQKGTLVRLHSECLTGDVFHSNRCDCGEQLALAMQKAAEQSGVVVYLRQEGRGIGLINKLEAYNLQDSGLNTAEANTHLGFEEDARNYDSAVVILKHLGIKNLRLLTNNPLKIQALEVAGLSIVSRESIIISPKSENLAYLHTKRDLMGHLLD
jgi:GTP cyclohydrolase II